jgi:ribose 1,5-bisphosphate isomerase
MKEVDRIIRNIKSVKIQGATNIAKAAAKAYHLNPTKQTKNRLLSARPTEPTLSNVLNHLIERGWSDKQVLDHFKESQDRINRFVFKIIKNKSIVFTHCHSTNVGKSLVYSKMQGKKFEVFNTETRPLLQGRITARELSKADIKVTTFIDSGLHEAIEDSDILLLGADAILKNGVINKIGSTIAAEIAHVHKIPFYIVADSWKYSPRNVKIEERDFKEVWKDAPKNINVKNPAFEFIPRKYIKGVISEYGILKYPDFLRKVKNL